MKKRTILLISVISCIITAFAQKKAIVYGSNPQAGHYAPLMALNSITKSTEVANH